LPISNWPARGDGNPKDEGPKPERNPKDEIPTDTVSKPTALANKTGRQKIGIREWDILRAIQEEQSDRKEVAQIFNLPYRRFVIICNRQASIWNRLPIAGSFENPRRAG
jgi:hypothetical protein